MNAEVFLDTKVFIYHLDTTDRRKHEVAEGIVRAGLLGGDACISFQVVQECLNICLNKAKLALDAESARGYLDHVLGPLMQVPASIALYHHALDVQARWKFGFYDAMIVAAALAAGCRRLLSEDLQHCQRIETLTIENPFQ